MSYRHVLLGVIGALVLIMGTMVTGVTGASPAYAGNCTGTTCIGHDPDAEGCPSSSITSAAAYSGATKLATVWNKYSVPCNTNWASAQLTTAAINDGYTLYDEVYTWDKNGTFESMCFPGPDNTGLNPEGCTNWPRSGYCCSGYPYTDMVWGATTTYADVFVINSSGTIVASAEAPQ
jgi:hypothetical protein